MELILKRNIKSPNSTIGTLEKVNISGANEQLCFTLEDVDRGLTDLMDIATVSSKKVFGKTAIPKGRYRIIISFSNHFQKYLPELLNVKGYEGIRIHSGNTAADTEGCILTGQTHGVDMVNNSRNAFNYLFSLLQAADKTEKNYITIL